MICRKYAYACDIIGWDWTSQEEPKPVEDGTFASDNRALEEVERVGAYGFAS